MTWTRLSDDFADRPEVLNLSDAAFRAHVNALVYCNRLLTDGAVPRAALRLLTDADHAVVLAELEAGLWFPTEHGWQLDWTDQETAANVQQRKQSSAERQRLFQERKTRHGAGDHTMCDPRYCKASTTPEQGHNTPPNALPNALDNASLTAPRPDPSRPVPSRPKGQGQGQGQGPDDDADALGGATPPPAENNPASPQREGNNLTTEERNAAEKQQRKRLDPVNRIGLKFLPDETEWHEATNANRAEWVSDLVANVEKWPSWLAWHDEHPNGTRAEWVHHLAASTRHTQP